MPETREIPGPGGETMVQTDYVEPGSDEHAAALGLRKWREGDAPELKIEGWTFADITELVRYSASAMSVQIARGILEQRVAELKPVTIEVREAQGRQRAYIEKGKTIIEAPPMFNPTERRRL